jgi:hypothetical protein
MADDSKRLDRELNKLVKTLSNTRRLNRVQIAILKDLEGRLKNRVFNKGLASDGRKIGNYSTDDILIGASSFRTKTQAKKVLGSKRNRKKLEWRKVKGRNLAILEGGYKELRKKQGLRTDRVDLEYRSDLRNSIIVGKTPDRQNALGFQNNEQRVIAEANEDRFNKSIFGTSRSENIAIEKAFIREVDFLLKQVFR